MKTGKIYAVAHGRKCGVYASWQECQKQVKGFSKAVFRSFATKSEAEEFISKYQNSFHDSRTGGPELGKVSFYRESPPPSDLSDAPIASISNRPHSPPVKRPPPQPSELTSEATSQLSPASQKVKTLKDLFNKFNEDASQLFDGIERDEKEAATPTNEPTAFRRTETDFPKVPTTKESKSVSWPTSATETLPVVSAQKRKLESESPFEIFTKKRLSQSTSAEPPQPQDITYVHTDGACQHKLCGAGFLIEDSASHLIAKKSIPLGAFHTNNEAEYSALILALQECLDRGLKKVMVRTDSLLVVQQTNGLYEVKEDRLKRLHARVTELKAQFSYFRIEHVYRRFNKEADGLSKQGLMEGR